MSSRNKARNVPGWFDSKMKSGFDNERDNGNKPSLHRAPTEASLTPRGKLSV
jgi:hypothetical protein